MKTLDLVQSDDSALPFYIIRDCSGNVTILPAFKDSQKPCGCFSGEISFRKSECDLYHSMAADILYDRDILCYRYS